MDIHQLAHNIIDRETWWKGHVRRYGEVDTCVDRVTEPGQQQQGPGEDGARGEHDGGGKQHGQQGEGQGEVVLGGGHQPPHSRRHRAPRQPGVML